MKSYFWLVCLSVTLISNVFAERQVNVYVWGGEIPKKLIQQFEQQTKIRVNFSTYDSNETMFAKLKANRKNVYDVILPSSYYVERMQKQGMLMPLDHTRLPGLSNLDPMFSKNDYDRGNGYSIPLIWGITGIFYQGNRVSNPPHSWKQLWESRWHEQLLLLDDAREVFAMSLMSLGFLPNDDNPLHIKNAYEHLLTLIPNIRLFASESIQAILIDEDAILGMVWNGDVYKAHAESQQVQFVYPEDGFVIWVDCLAIPNHPPHPDEAYQFIDFMLQASSGAEITLSEGHANTNAQSKNLLPESIHQNPLLYPPAEILKRGYFQRDVGEKTVELYNQYWQELKLSL